MPHPGSAFSLLCLRFCTIQREIGPVQWVVPGAELTDKKPIRADGQFQADEGLPRAVHPCPLHQTLGLLADPGLPRVVPCVSAEALPHLSAQPVVSKPILAAVKVRVSGVYG